MHDDTARDYISDDKVDANDSDDANDNKATPPLIFLIPPHNPQPS